jgi:hypothetical protein
MRNTFAVRSGRGRDRCTYDEMGEMVLGVVQPAEVVTDRSLDEELRAFESSELGDVKTLRRIDFTDELPREPTGKLFKHKVRDANWTCFIKVESFPCMKGELDDEADWIYERV